MSSEVELVDEYVGRSGCERPNTGHVTSAISAVALKPASTVLSFTQTRPVFIVEHYLQTHS